jgi:8-oxo-dGTP diphosphatase
VREVAEETGLAIRGVRLVATENVLFSEAAHYVVLFMAGTAPPGSQPRVLEPNKCTEWRWCAWDELPSPLFKPLQQFRDKGLRPPGPQQC